MPFDFDRNSSELKIDKKTYLRILDAAVQQTEQDLSLMADALQRNDLATPQTISHRWKGDFANLRISPLSEIARQMNEAAKTNAAEPMPKFLEQFRQLFDTLKKELIFNKPA